MSFTPFFVQPFPSIHYAELIFRALEGIDWQKSFQAFCKDGKQAKPVFQWEQ